MIVYQGGWEVQVMFTHESTWARNIAEPNFFMEVAE